MAGSAKAPLQRSAGLQLRHQAAFGIQSHQVITATHMRLTDEDLRHCAATCDFHHVVTRLGLGVDPDFLNVRDAFGLQHLFGADTVGANGRCVHLHLWHDNSRFDG